MFKMNRYILVNIRKLLITETWISSTPTDLDDIRSLGALKTSESETGAKYYY
jgi:hypothetical protein